LSSGNYAALDTRESLWIILATLAVMLGGHAVLYSVQASLIPELFSTRLRYSGASLGYQLATPFAGGLSPIIAASLVAAFDFRPLTSLPTAYLFCRSRHRGPRGVWPALDLVGLTRAAFG
jgi:hypothetical protein